MNFHVSVSVHFGLRINEKNKYAAKVFLKANLLELAPWLESHEKAIYEICKHVHAKPKADEIPWFAQK